MRYSLAVLIFVIAVIIMINVFQHPPSSPKGNIDPKQIKNSDDVTKSEEIVIVAAGDIACPSLKETSTDCNQQLTANLVEAINPNFILIPGDLQYPIATLSNFENYFDKSWGKFKPKLKPVPGNHDYAVPFAEGYFDYFNGTHNPSGVAGDRDKGYYSFDIENWHIIGLNSNCWAIGGCSQNSPQLEWLEQDLQNSVPEKCQIAFFHHPLFSSGLHGDNPEMKEIFNSLFNHHVEIVINGHDHIYQRLAKIDASGKKVEQGVRQFIVGTGGMNLYHFLHSRILSESKQNQEFGVLKLTLLKSSYEWDFISIKQNGFSDKGSDVCF